MESYTKDIRLEKDSVEPYDKWLQREVELQELARSLYPFVPEILDIEGTNIVMEKVNGITVKDYLLQDGNFRKYRSLLSHLKSILSLFHKNGLIHGDTNLDNYIISDNIPFNVWVIDFGLAKRTTDSRVYKRELEKLERNVIFLIAMLLSDMYSYNSTKKDKMWFKQEFGLTPSEYIELM